MSEKKMESSNVVAVPSISTSNAVLNKTESRAGQFRSFIYKCGYDTWRYFGEYANITEIHGVRYMTENRSLFEKLFWAMLIFLSIAGCIMMMITLYNKYDRAPVIVSFATEETPIYDIPFPAVTICPETKTTNRIYTVLKEKLRHNRTALTLDDIKMYSYLYLICDHFLHGQDIDIEIENNATITDDFYKTINKIKPKTEDWMYGCVYMGFVFNCSQIFKKIITDQGICYTFNMLDRSRIFKSNVNFYLDFFRASNQSNDWNGDKGYGPDATLDVYPQRALRSGADNALDIFIAQSRDHFDFECTSSVSGVRVVLHNPMELPRLKKYYFRVALESATTVAVRPNLMLTSGQVMKYTAEKRKCFLEMERPLQFFKRYSQANCLMECLMNFTKTYCGCVNFYMPHDNDTKICGIGKYECLLRQEDSWEFQEVERKLKHTTLDMKSCDCLPLCTELRYNTEISVSDWDWRTVNEPILKVNPEGRSLEVSRLTIFFKSEFFMKLERNELYGLAELIASLGGLLGLFSGISVITIVEIIYFLTIRIWCNKRLYGPWAGPKINK